MRSFFSFTFLCCLLFLNRPAHAQSDSDHTYRKPLQEVLEQISQRFGVKVKYSREQVKDKWVNYAGWRFRPDLNQTFEEVLKPLDMKVNDEGHGVYKLKEYEYHRWAPADGWAMLDSLSKRYPSLESWEKRKAALKPAIFQALQLSPMPRPAATKPVLTRKRLFDGYTVENISIELIPGLYLNGSVYKPAKMKGKVPVVMSPDGHWAGHRYRKDCQVRCATLARMGAMAVSYDLFGWGESLLQFKSSDHRRSLAMTIQTLGGIRMLDYIYGLPQTDRQRIAISGGSGGGSHTVLMAALDDRITLSAPVVSLSSYFFGGCPCESGMPIHFAEGGTNNVELAAMAAPRPQLVVSDGQDWTAQMPEHDFPWLQRQYARYGASALVENVHLPKEGHDFGYSKRKALYDFLVRHFKLDASRIRTHAGDYDETGCTVEPEKALYAFGDNGEYLPATAIHGFDELVSAFDRYRKK